MPYDFKFSEAALANLHRVSATVAAQIEAGLLRLAADPEKYGRRAVSPPFPPFGYQCDIECEDPDTGGKYNCVALYVYSDCGAFLEVHRMLIQVIWEPEAVRRRRQSEGDDAE